MRRFYVLALAAMSANCLTDAFASNGGEPAGAIGTTTFSADIINLPAIDKHEIIGVNEAVASDPQTQSPVETVSAKPPVHPAFPVEQDSHGCCSAAPDAAPRLTQHRTLKGHTTVDEFATLASAGRVGSRR